MGALDTNVLARCFVDDAKAAKRRPAAVAALDAFDMGSNSRMRCT